MRKSEEAALKAAVEQIQTGINAIVSIIGGTVPAQAKVAAAPTKKTLAVPKVAAPAGPVQACIGVDDEGNFGCLIDNEGPFSIGDAAVHAYQAHGIKMVDIAVDPPEALTHGRKWMMKRALEKAGLTAALEGYGRGAAKPAKAKPAKAAAPAPAPAPAAAPAKKKKWFKDEKGKWKKVKEETPAAPSAPTTPATGKAAAPQKKSWMKKTVTTATAAAPAGVKDFQTKYKLTNEQVEYVQKFAVEHKLTLEEAAEKIALEESEKA